MIDAVAVKDKIVGIVVEAAKSLVGLLQRDVDILDIQPCNLGTVVAVAVHCVRHSAVSDAQREKADTEEGDSLAAGSPC